MSCRIVTPKSNKACMLQRLIIRVCGIGLMCLMTSGLTLGHARPLVFGYFAWWVDQDETIRSLPDVDRLKFMEWRLGPDGRIAAKHGWPADWKHVRSHAATLGIPVDVTLTLFDVADFNALFGSPERVKRLQKELVQQLDSDPGIAGIHWDVEIFSVVNAQAQQRYKALVGELAAQLKRMQPARSTSVFLSYNADQYLYDAASLVHVDHIIVQGYDAHWVSSELAGPLAPLAGSDAVTWEKMLASARRLNVPASRLLMGFPAYGYEWTVKPCTPRGKRIAPGEITTFARLHMPNAPELRHNVVDRVLAHGVQYDATTGSAHYQFSNPDGSCQVGWFEDWWTLQRKTDWILKEKLAGMAFFPLGYDGGDLVGMTARRFRAIPEKSPEPVQLQAQ